MYFSFALAGHRGTCLRPLYIFALLLLCSALNNEQSASNLVRRWRADPACIGSAQCLRLSGRFFHIHNNNNINNNNNLRSVSHMGCYSRYRAGRLLHFGLCILSWRRSWDGDGCVQKTSQVRRIVRVVRVPADCFGNLRPIQRIGCAVSVLKRSGPQNHFCLCRW